jgi:cell division protein FtsB
MPRPVPRRRTSSGRPASRVHWDRVGRIALVIVLFLVLASYINPLLDLADTWRDSRADRTEMRSLDRENTRLRRRARQLSHRDVLEREARRVGMVREGERSYVIRGLGR